MMKIIKYFAPVLLILIVGCAGTKSSGSTEERGSRDIPEWYKKLSAHGVGKLNIKGCFLSPEMKTKVNTSIIHIDLRVICKITNYKDNE